MWHRPKLAGLLVVLASLAGLVLFPGGRAQATLPGPDGRIAFSDYLTGQIYAVNPDGTGLQQLTDVRGRAAAEWPDWSPDSRHIAFDTNRSGSLRLWIMEADGSHQRMVAEDRPATQDLLPAYTPDGTRLVFTRCVPRACAISSIGIDGTHRKMLTPFQRPPFEVVDLWPSVSPDGRWIAFARRNRNVDGVVSQLWVMRSDGSDAHPVTSPKLEADTPDWSPDSRRITFYGPCCKLGENIYTMGMDGTGVEKLTSLRFPHNAFTSSYSPSGNQIAYVSDEAYPDACCTDLFIMNVDGTGQTNILPAGSGLQAVAWGSAPTVAAGSAVTTIPLGSPSEAKARRAAWRHMLPVPVRRLLAAA